MPRLAQPCQQSGSCKNEYLAKILNVLRQHSPNSSMLRTLKFPTKPKNSTLANSVKDTANTQKEKNTTLLPNRCRSQAKSSSNKQQGVG